MVCCRSDRCTVLAFEDRRVDLPVDSSDDVAKLEPFGDRWAEGVALEVEEGNWREEVSAAPVQGIGCSPRDPQTS